MKKIALFALPLMLMSNNGVQAQNIATIFSNDEKIAVDDDTIYFNAKTYLTPEGATLEALVKILPAAAITEEGNVTIYNKSISKILINGQEFFCNDIQTALKNLPAENISYIKFYERMSDVARVTGINDLEEYAVLDIQYKQEMFNAISGTLNGALGTQHRYEGEISLDYLKGDSRITTFGTADNTKRNFISNSGITTGSGYLNATKQIGLDFFTHTDKLEIGGGGRFIYNGSDSRQISSSENAISTTSLSFQENLNQNNNSNFSVNSNFRLEWKPTESTNILFRPYYSYSKNRGETISKIYIFNKDPYNYSTNPLEKIDSLISLIDKIVSSTSNSFHQRNTWNSQLGGSLQVVHKFEKEGRNLRLNVNGDFSNGGSHDLTASKSSYFLSSITDNINNKYNNVPLKSNHIVAQLSYTEPIAERTYLEIKYSYDYNYSNNDNQIFTYDAAAYEELRNSLLANRYDIDAVLDYMKAHNHALTENITTGKFSENKKTQHIASLSLQKVTDKLNIIAGIDLLPTKEQLDMRINGNSYSVEKNRFNFSPRVSMRYDFNPATELHASYSGIKNQPSLSYFIEDISDPYNVTKANPDLKSSFTHNLHALFLTTNPETKNSYFANANGSIVQNSIANARYYDSSTGINYTKPENINGNWNFGLGGGFNIFLDENKYFNIENKAGLNYINRVLYQSEAKRDPVTKAISEYDNNKSTTKTWSINDYLKINYRKGSLQASIIGNVDYNSTRYDLTSLTGLSNAETWIFSYGAAIDYTAPWGTSISTDIAMNSRRGFNNENNTNELIWNAQLAQKLFNNKLSIALEAYDILGELSNFTRLITATQISDSYTNAIYQYGALRLIYNFGIGL